jgi:hypothetical protein
MRNDQSVTTNTSRSARDVAQTPTADDIVQMSFRLPRARWKRLRELSLDERSSVQSIIVAALEAEFARRGMSF